MTATPEFRRVPKDALFLHAHEARHGFHAYVFEQGEFPVKPLLLRRWLDLYHALRPVLFPPGKGTITGLQMWQIHHNDGAGVLARNGAAWQPDFGVGVWLDQPPPTLWSPEEFEMLGPGDTLRPPILTAIRLTAGRLDHHAVWVGMGGRGAFLEFAIDGEPEVFLERQAESYRQWIEEEIIKAHPFFLPLVSASSFESELFGGRIGHFDAVTTYVRESQEDKGLLIVARENLEKQLASIASLTPWTGSAPGVATFLVNQINA